MNTAFANAALLAAGSTGGTISMAITALAAVVILVSAFYGMSRGMYKTAIRIVTIGLSIFLTYHAVKLITKYLHSLFVGRTVEEIITRFWPGYATAFNDNVHGIANSFDAATVERLIAAFTVILIIPIVFIIIFHVMKLLTLFLYAIAHGILRVGKAKSPVSMIMGCLLGVLQGLLIVWATLMPIAGVAGIAEDARDSLINDKDPDVSRNITNVYVKYLDDVCENPVLKLVQGFGGDMMFSGITTVTVGDDTVDMQKEAIVLAKIGADGYPLIDGGFTWAELRAKDKKAMNSILDDVAADDYTANTVAGIMRGIANSNRDGYFNLGFKEPFKGFMDEFIAVFEDSDRDNIEDDFRTFLDVYFILNDARVLSHFGGGITESTAEALLSAKDGEEKVINKVIDRLSENPRTAPIVTSLTKFSLQLMAESSGNVLPEGVDADQLYDDVKVGMKDVLASVNDESIPEEEKRDAVKDSLNETLINSGVVTEEKPLNEDAMNSITDYVMENYTGKEELTDEDINNAIFAYYDQQGLVNPDGTIPEGTIPEGIIPGGADGE